MNIPETKAFDKCIDMFIEWKNRDHSEQSKQLIRDSKFDQLYLGPCKRELRKIIMFMDEQERDKLIIVTIKELLGTVDKGYVKNRRKTRSDYEDSGYYAAMTLDEYLIREDRAYAYSDLMSQFQLYLFIDIWHICREYKIQIEKILKDLKIDLNDYFTVDARRFYTGNKGFPKPEIKIRTEYRPFFENTKTQLVPSPQIQAKEAEQLKPDYEKELAEIRNSENKFWKGLPMEQVVKHFEVMTIRKNKEGMPYLTPEQLVSFLKKGFLNGTDQPVQKINCTRGEKGL
ncbi:MAG: hypothetical protein K0B37_16185 [Bacteroidales bacterium]|nr:hypothetical protein [Bacteroidales bacterium]